MLGALASLKVLPYVALAAGAVGVFWRLDSLSDDRDRWRAKTETAEKALSAAEAREARRAFVDVFDRNLANEMQALREEVADLEPIQGAPVYVQPRTPNCPPVSISTERVRNRADEYSALLRTSATGADDPGDGSTEPGSQ